MGVGWQEGGRAGEDSVGSPVRWTADGSAAQPPARLSPIGDSSLFEGWSSRAPLQVHACPPTIRPPPAATNARIVAALVPTLAWWPLMMYRSATLVLMALLAMAPAEANSAGSCGGG